MEAERSKNKPQYTIVVPAYNEERGLPIVLEKILKVIDDRYEVLVVDDGSADGTSKAAGRFPVRLIRHEINQGKGKAIITGINNAKTDLIIFIDADDTYPAEAIPQMAEDLETVDVVVGSRFYGKENIPRFNRIGNYLIRNAIRYCYGYKPYDPLTGLWGMKKQVALKVLPEARYAPDAEMQMKAARLKVPMRDIKIHYNARVGDTKLPSIKAGYEHFKLILTLLRWQPEKIGHDK
jgi:glycosyltransferase involved in cell wall biosynthesis